MMKIGRALLGIFAYPCCGCAFQSWVGDAATQLMLGLCSWTSLAPGFLQTSKPKSGLQTLRAFNRRLSCIAKSLSTREDLAPKAIYNYWTPWTWLQALLQVQESGSYKERFLTGRGKQIFSLQNEWALQTCAKPMLKWTGFSIRWSSAFSYNFLLLWH